MADPPLRVDRRVNAGDAFAFTVTVDEGLVGASLRCTVKRRRSDGDAAAIAYSVPTIDSATQATVTFLPGDTEDWPAASIWYDVQAVDAGGAPVRTLIHGALDVRSRVTRTRSLATPLEIFGDDLAFWFRAEDFVPADAGTSTPANWPSVGSLETMASFPPQLMPAGGGVLQSPSAAFGINGLPTVLSDGVNDIIGTPLNTDLSSGTRPYFAMLMRPESTSNPSGNTSFGEVFTTFSTGGVTRLGLKVVNIGGLGVHRYVCSFFTNPGGANITGPVYDTDDHVIELTYADTLGDHFRFDGVEQTTVFNGTPNTLPTGDTIFSIALFRKADSQTDVNQRPLNIHMRDLVGVRRLPTADERARLYAYLDHRRTAA